MRWGTLAGFAALDLVLAVTFADLAAPVVGLAFVAARRAPAPSNGEPAAGSGRSPSEHRRTWLRRIASLLGAEEVQGVVALMFFVR